ncbi:hypothetical protein ES707_11220 [subsurface metagenome]
MSIRVNAIGIELNQDFMLIARKKNAIEAHRGTFSR